MKKIKRLCLFVVYSQTGKISEYVKFLGDALEAITEKVITIYQCDKLEDNLMLGDSIYRKNIGYDAGAYQDALLNYIGMDTLKEYDELLLVNDSCFGPIFSLEDIFTYMESKNVDFWGMTEHESKENPKHVQSYFLLFRNRVITSKVFKKFWDEYQPSDNIYDTVLRFEIGLSQKLIKSGFSYTSYASESGCKRCVNAPLYSDIMLFAKDYGIPFVKRKAINVSNYDECKRLFEFIKNDTQYPVNYILDFLDCWLLQPFNKKEFKAFYEKHERIFIYGKGKVGQGFSSYFKDNQLQYEDMIVTSDLSHIHFENNDGVIIATTVREYCEEMMKQLFNKGLTMRNILMAENNKEYFQYQLMNNWIMHLHEGKSIADYFREEGIKNIAIYGLGDISNRIFEELEGSDISILYGIDRDLSITNSQIPEVYTLDDDLKEVDAIVVTPFYAYEDIMKALTKKKRFRVISIEEIIYSL